MSRWVLYNSAGKDGGSINQFFANSVEDLIKQVVAYEDPYDKLCEAGWSAQNDDDYSQVVLFYPDGAVAVMVEGVEHPYTADDQES